MYIVHVCMQLCVVLSVCVCVCVLGVGGRGVLWGLGHRDIQRIVLSLKFMILAFFL